MSQSLLDRIKNKRQALQAKNNRERAGKLSQAKNVIRILPSWTGDPDGAFYQDFGQHFIKDQAGKVLAVYICTANTFGKPCDLCGAIANAAASMDPNDKSGMELLHEARGGSRVLINVLYMNGTHANPEKEPVFIEIPPTVMDDVLAIAIEYSEQHDINIFDLKEGYNLTIEKSGSGRDTEYKVIASPKSSAVPDGVMSKVRNLEDFAKQEYDEGLQKAITTLRSLTNTGGSTVPLVNGPSSVGKAGSQRLIESEAIDMDDDVELAEAAIEAAEPKPVEKREAVTIEQEATPAPVKAKPAPTPAPVASSAEAELDELEALLDAAA